MVFIKEDPIEAQVDNASGLTKEVVDMIKSGALAIPDTAQYALEKYPCKGEVISIGPKVSQIKLGDRVIFGRLGGMRINEGTYQMIVIREIDILAILS